MESKKRKKIASFFIGLGLLFFVQLVYFLINRTEQTRLLIVGIFLMYATSFLILASFQELFEIKDRVLYAFLGISFPFYIQKHTYVFRELWKENHSLRNINYLFISIFLILILVSYIRNREKNWKESFSLEKIRNYALYFLPFFLLAAKERKILWFFIAIAVLYFFYNKEWKRIKNRKERITMAFFVILYLVFSWSSRMHGFVSDFGNQLYSKEFYYYSLFLSLLFIPVSKEMFQKIKLSLLFSGLFPLSIALLEWISYDYSFFKAIGTEEWTSMWAVRALLLSLLYFFFYLYEKKGILLYLALLSTWTMFLSQGRGPLLSFVISFVIMVFFWAYKAGKMKYFWGASLFLVAVFFFLFHTDNYIIYKIKLVLAGNDNSTNTRIVLYKGAIEQWRHSKYLGYGLGTLKETAESLKQASLLQYNLENMPHAHNNLLELLRSVGLFGTLSYIFIKLYGLWYFLQNFWRGKTMYLLPLVFILSFELAGVTDYTLFMFRSLSLLLFITGICFSLNEE